MPPYVPVEKRFWKFVKKSKSCWEWVGAVNKAGYGVLGVNNVPTRAHRISYEMHIGAIPDGMNVCHKCDNPPCVNPDHLFLGSHKQNMQDMVKKGRHSSITHPERIARGERHGSKTHPESREKGDEHWTNRMPDKITWIGENNNTSKLKEKDVLEIRELSSNGESQRSLARRFKVCKSTIYWIIRGVNWKHLLTN